MATRLRSFAKVNLGLRIGPVRADGFHGLATVYQTLALHDVVTVSARRSGATRIVLTTDHPRVPVDGRNTVWQMVERALRAMGVAAEVNVHLEKRLPVQGGMGAGSANAAAALLGLEEEMRGWEDTAPELGGVERLRLAAECGIGCAAVSGRWDGAGTGARGDGGAVAGCASGAGRADAGGGCGVRGGGSERGGIDAGGISGVGSPSVRPCNIDTSRRIF